MLRTCFAAAGSTLLLALVACTGGPGDPSTLTQQNRSGQGGDVGGDLADQIRRAQEEAAKGERGSSGAAVPPASSRISVGEFKKDCEQDSDCTAVYEGEVCGGCDCENEAIAASERSAYERKKLEATIACVSGGSVPSAADCGECPTKTAVCDQGSKKCRLN